MIDLRPSINFNGINLGDNLSSAKLRESKIKKLGFIGKLFVKREAGEIVYWVKNCKVLFFDYGEGATISKMLEEDSSAAIFPYSHAGEHAGTSAYLFFKNDKLNKIIFQVIGNKKIATMFLVNLSKCLIKKYGEPKNNGNAYEIWEDSDSKLIIELPPDSQNGHIHWIKK